MISIHIRRKSINLISNKNPYFLHKPHLFLSSYFSTSVKNNPLIAPDFSELLMRKYQFDPQSASQLASVLSTLRNPQRSDSTLSFFITTGFSVTQLEKIVKSWPEFLSVNLDKIIKPKIKIFQEFGFSSNEIVEIISKDPSILHSSANNKVIPALSVLKSLVGSTEKVARVLRASGWYLKSDLTKCLVPNIEMLMGCGVSMDRIFWLMYYLPRILLQKPEIMRKYIEKADELGADRRSKMFIHAVRVVSSMSDGSWELKMRAFRDVGFSDEDISRVFRMAPLVFAVSEEKVKKVKEVVLETGKYDMWCIVSNPTALCRSIEKRLKPRIEVLKVLEGRNLIEKWPSFLAVYKFPDKQFFERFVSPYYSEVGEMYLAKTGFSDESEVNYVRSRKELRLSR